MGCWGMGLAQSDEFLEVYDSFLEEYDRGGEPAEVREKILSDYMEQFGADDPILHDVWFALAKAEWMIGIQSEKVLRRVQDIIESGENLVFYQELGADKRDLSARKKNLNAFWIKLSTPREKPRKRKLPAKEKILPPLEPGDVISYPVEGGRRVAVILDRFKSHFWIEGYYCCILQRTFDRNDLKTLQLLDEEVARVGLYNAYAFLPPSSVRKIDHISVLDHLYERHFSSGHQIILIDGERKDFFLNRQNAEPFSLSELLAAKRVPKRLKKEIGYEMVSELTLYP